MGEAQDPRFPRFGKQRASAEATGSLTGCPHTSPGLPTLRGQRVPHTRGSRHPAWVRPRTGRDARPKAAAGVWQPRSERQRRGGGCGCGGPKTRTHKSQPLLCSRACSIFLQLRRGRNTALYITACAPKHPLPVPPLPTGHTGSASPGGTASPQPPAPRRVLSRTITIIAAAIIPLPARRCLQRQRSPRDSSARCSRGEQNAVRLR